MTKGSARDEWGRFSSVVGFIYLFKLSLIKLSLSVDVHSRGLSVVGGWRRWAHAMGGL
jgi:hypothetical protein